MKEFTLMGVVASLNRVAGEDLHISNLKNDKVTQMKAKLNNYLNITNLKLESLNEPIQAALKNNDNINLNDAFSEINNNNTLNLT